MRAVDIDCKHSIGIGKYRETSSLISWQLSSTFTTLLVLFYSPTSPEEKIHYSTFTWFGVAHVVFRMVHYSQSFVTRTTDGNTVNASSESKTKRFNSIQFFAGKSKTMSRQM